MSRDLCVSHDKPIGPVVDLYPPITTSLRLTFDQVRHVGPRIHKSRALDFIENLVVDTLTGRAACTSFRGSRSVPIFFRSAHLVGADNAG